MFKVFGNFGNNTIALIQWCVEARLNDVVVVHVETGWAADTWERRVSKAMAYIKESGFDSVLLKPKATFQEMVIDRRHFPSPKFQWCAGFLKGLPFFRVGGSGRPRMPIYGCFRFKTR